MGKAKAVVKRKADGSAALAFRELIRVSGVLRRVQEPYFQRAGISGAQWGVLRVLFRAEEAGDAGVRLAELGDRLLIRPPSVTGVVDRLERMGLVSREAAPDDLRAKHVKLTGSGRALVQRVLVSHGQRTELLMAGLSTAEQRSLRTMLEKLSVHMAKLSPGDVVDQIS